MAKPKTVLKTAPEALLEALAEIGWSQAELSRRLGVHKNTVSDWVAGKYPVPRYATVFIKVALEAVKARDKLTAFLKPTPRED